MGAVTAGSGALSVVLPETHTSRRSVIVGLCVAIAQTVALAVAAILTGSVAMRTQTITNVADVAVGAFLLIGVISSERLADDDHPLGYGRERFFWSFVAAAGIFIGGVGAAAIETVRASQHASATGSYTVGYVVLAVVVLLDLLALVTGLRPLQQQARRRHLSFTQLLWRGTDPAVTTVVLSSAAGLAGGILAAGALAGREVTGRAALDALGSGLIGVVLLVTSVVLLHTNRELLTGRGVSSALVSAMRSVVSSQPGVVGVPDIFAIVVGASTLIVDGDVIFDDSLDVPHVEQTIRHAADSLRASWPSIAYVYLNPVAAKRQRRRTMPSS